MRINEIERSLHALRTHFSHGDSCRKQKLLTELAKSPLHDPHVLRDYHDTLLFMAAYPDDPETLRHVRSGLKRIGANVRRLQRSDATQVESRLRNTGISHTQIIDSFTLPMTQWLIKTFPNGVELEWDEDSAGEALDEFLNLLINHVEGDGLLNPRFSTRQWFDLAKGRRQRKALDWLVEQFAHLDASPLVREQAFDALELQMRWTLSANIASRTLARFPRRPTFFQTTALQRDLLVKEWIAQPLPSPQSLSAGEVRRLLDVCRITLCVRQREIDPLTYVNPREVVLLRLPRGIDVAVFGMQPSRRLPIESYFGFVTARNRVPIGYGGGWVLGDRCEIGVNIFDEFRGGESAYVFGQVMRVYHHWLGVHHFVVDSYQFGDGNAEAIRSGAYWFYDRLGFRSVDKRMRRLADQERERCCADRSYRSSERTLRRLAGAKVFLDLITDHPSKWKDIELSNVGIAVTRWIGKRFNGDRQAAQRWAQRRALHHLKVRGMSKWPADQQESFRRMSLLLGLARDIPSWSTTEKKAMIAVMRAKGGLSERTYVNRARRHMRYLNVLRTLAKDG